MPLWNRTVDSSLSYQLYTDAIATTLQLAGDQTATDPGPASLTCLSCHDGVTAIDSIINMPGSGNYRAAQRESVDLGFLAGWSATTSSNVPLSRCAEQCHNPGLPGFPSPGDFTKFVIGAGTVDASGEDRKSVV